VEGKKETLFFTVHLCLFKIEDAPAVVAKEKYVLVWRVSDYASKGRRVLVGAHPLLATKAGVSPFSYKGT
jgi:hypothetical protein